MHRPKDREPSTHPPARSLTASMFLSEAQLVVRHVWGAGVASGDGDASTQLDWISGACSIERTLTESELVERKADAAETLDNSGASACFAGIIEK